jgi:hypothetical protein
MPEDVAIVMRIFGVSLIFCIMNAPKSLLIII